MDPQRLSKEEPRGRQAPRDGFLSARAVRIRPGACSPPLRAGRGLRRKLAQTSTLRTLARGPPAPVLLTSRAAAQWVRRFSAYSLSGWELGRWALEGGTKTADWKRADELKSSGQ